MNICTIYQNLACLLRAKGLFYFRIIHLFDYLEQYPIPFFSLGRVPAAMQDDFTGLLMSYIFSYAIINELCMEA